MPPKKSKKSTNAFTTAMETRNNSKCNVEYEKLEEIADSRNRNRYQFTSGHYRTKDWEIVEMSSDPNGEYPGPVGKDAEGEDVYRVEAVYDFEWIIDTDDEEGDGWPGFSVRWKGWPPEFDTIEPFDRLLDTREARRCAKMCGINLNSGSANTRVRQRGVRSALKKLRRKYSPEEVRERFLHFIMTRSKVEDIAVEGNSFQRLANELFRENRASNKFCLVLGFFNLNNEKESHLVFQYELDFWSDLRAKWSELRIESDFELYPKFIGEKPDELKDANYNGRYSESTQNIATDFRKILKRSKDVIALIMSRVGDGAQEDTHCCVLVVRETGGVRE
ncbi:unnamed protein product, partial [Oppiella nova]